MAKRSRIQTQIGDRRARRKEERRAKKKKRPLTSQQSTDESTSASNGQEYASTSSSSNNSNEGRSDEEKQQQQQQLSRKENKKQKKTKNKKKDIFDILDEETAAAVRKDDEEIAFLEKSLGLNKGKKDKKKLNKEYAKLEGYGDDFGDFLDGLDGIMGKITGGDDDYGDEQDDVDFLSDESDNEVSRARKLLQEELDMSDSDGSGDDESNGEEIVPMKSASDNDDDEYESDGKISSDDETGYNKKGSKDQSQTMSDEDEDMSEVDDDSDNDSEEEEEDIRDHDEEHTYRPLTGQDLYGNLKTEDTGDEQPKKYVPPHLRKQQQEDGEGTDHKSSQSRLLQDDNDPERKEKLRQLQRLLNNNLNRLADNTLESVAKSISSIYTSHDYSIRDTNECFWKNLKTACVVEHMVRSGLIPIYMACVAGVHFQAGDTVQLGGDMMERALLALWDELKKYRDSGSNVDADGKTYISKEASNYMLIFCYLYNYGVVHCTIIYDLIRTFIKNFTELDVELLLLILSHCGQQLRSDDPTSLKDIVNMVQKRSLEMMNDDGMNNANASTSYSRAQFMVTAITDLKNNKRKSKDVIISEKTSFYRKVIGRMKSVVSTIGVGKSLASTSLRVTVQDILDIETKGRWWKVGAKWAGLSNDKRNGQMDDDAQQATLIIKTNDKKQQKLLALAAKQRMNTDLRRSIFCIIMGSDDCQDAFEKLVTSSMFKGKNEREVVRVLVHCCGTEKVYNPYYAHLAERVCEYQSKCKFTFQLTFWDCFKQFDTMKARKAANLAKIFASLLMKNRLNLNVLKVIDISPDDMPEAAIIFLTILFTTIFEAYDDTTEVVTLFKRGEPSAADLAKKASEEPDDDNLFAGNDREALKENLNIFLLHFLQSSPKNKKQSMFRKNLKAAVKACESDGFDSML